MAWTDEQRARVHPFRGDKVASLDPAEGAARVAAWWKDSHNRSGLKKAKGITAAAMKIFAAPDATKASDPEVEAAALWLVDQWSRRDLTDFEGHPNQRYAPVDAWFVQRWLAGGDVELALRTLAAFPAYEFVFDKGIEPRQGAPAWWALQQGHLGLFHALRRALVGRKSHAADAKIAAAVREKAPSFVRAAIAFAFPDEPFWEADLRAATPTKGRLLPESWALATTKVAEAQLAPILDSMARDDQPWNTGTQDYGFTLVHRLGDAAAPHLLGYLGIARGKTAKEAFASALALTKSKEARAFFESKIKDKTLGPIAKAYLG